MSDPIQAPPKRGRPAKPTETPTVVLTPEEKRRIEWEAFQAEDVEWQEGQKAEGNTPCPHCGMQKGYNPVTGIHVRTQVGRELIEGHRDSCPLNVSVKHKKPVR